MHCISRLEQVRLLCSLVYLNFVRVNSLVVFALCFNRYFFVFFVFCFHVCLHQNPCHIGEVHGFIRVFPLAVKRPLNTVTLPVTDRLQLRIKLDFSTLLTTSLYSWILATHLSFDCLAEGIVEVYGVQIVVTCDMSNTGMKITRTLYTLMCALSRVYCSVSTFTIATSSCLPKRRRSSSTRLRFINVLVNVIFSL